MPNPNLPINAKYNTYIGARYVPLMGGEWNIDNSYEPLVVVTYRGSSYTSNTFIPAGTDINNTTYWTKTGDYNAQVDQYRQEVTQVQNNLSSLTEQTKELQGLVNENQGGNTEAIQEINQKLQEVNASLEDINSDITEINNKDGQQDTTIDNLKKSITSLGNEVSINRDIMIGKASTSDISVCVYSSGFDFNGKLGTYKNTEIISTKANLSQTITLPYPSVRPDVVLFMINETAIPSNFNSKLNEWFNAWPYEHVQFIYTLLPISSLEHEIILNYVSMHRDLRQQVNNRFLYNPFGFVYGCVYPNYSHMAVIYNSMLYDAGQHLPPQYYYSSYGIVYTNSSGVTGTPNISVRTYATDYWLRASNASINFSTPIQPDDGNYTAYIGKYTQAPFPVESPHGMVWLSVTFTDDTVESVLGRINYGDASNNVWISFFITGATKAVKYIYLNSDHVPMPVIDQDYEKYSEQLDYYLFG